MPAVSQSQRRLFGMVYAHKKGKLKNVPKKIKEVADHISESDARDFAKTKSKGLPEKKACILDRMFAMGFASRILESSTNMR